MLSRKIKLDEVIHERVGWEFERVWARCGVVALLLHEHQRMTKDRDEPTVFPVQYCGRREVHVPSRLCCVCD
jgi:hypothetical protein